MDSETKPTGTPVDRLVIRCCLCNRIRQIGWYLSGYYGIGRPGCGQTCRQCYEGVSHDAFGKPRHPRRYFAALRRWADRYGDDMRILRLNLKRKWWEQIRDGEKTVEMRLATEYWRKRLIGREYDEIHLCLGYPKRGDESRMLRRKWQMVVKETIVHEEFGPEPVEVFCISVGASA